MKMQVVKVPRSLKVGPYTYKVRADKESRTRLQTMGYVGLSSSCENLHRIDIDAGLAQPAKTLVILHEVLHACDHMYNDGALGENVDHFAKGLTQVFEQMGVRLDV